MCYIYTSIVLKKKLWKHVSTACMTTRPPGKVWNNLNLERNNLSLHLIFLGTNISLYHIWKRKIIGSQLPFFQGILVSSLEANLLKAPGVFFPHKKHPAIVGSMGTSNFCASLGREKSWWAWGWWKPMGRWWKKSQKTTVWMYKTLVNTRRIHGMGIFTKPFHLVHLTIFRNHVGVYTSSPMDPSWDINWWTPRFRTNHQP